MSDRAEMSSFAIRDHCRKNLIRYTLRAISLVPLPAEPLVLDVGCGSGVPTLALMDACPGRFVAVDPDDVALRRLRRKAEARGQSARIELIQASVLALPPFPEEFDVVVAEGSLQAAGFPAAMVVVNGLLKPGGHALLHEPLVGDRSRRAFFKRSGLDLIDACVLDEETWRREYFSCLEQAVRRAGDGRSCAEAKREIAEFKRDPRSCRSIYYVLRKRAAPGNKSAGTAS